MDMKLMTGFLLVALSFAGCSKDDVSKNGDSVGGTWTAKVNGANWQAGRIEQNTHNDNLSLSGYSSTDKSVMGLWFEGYPKVTKIDIVGSGAGFSFYEDASVPGGEIGMDMVLDVTKYDGDSLVATFQFTTDVNREITEGVIKLKLK